MRIVRRGGGWTCLLLIASLTLAGAEMALPAVLGRAVDAVLGGHDFAPWLVGCGVLVGLLIVCDALDDLASGASTRVGTVLVWALTALIPALGWIVDLALIDPWLCLTFLIGAPVLLLLVRSNVRDASELADRYLRIQASIAARLVDALAGARTIAAARTEARERRRVLAPLPQLHGAGMGLWRVQTRLAAQQALLIPLLEIAVLAVAGIQLGRGQISAGQVLAAPQYVMPAAGVGSAVSSVSRFAQARAAAGRVAEVLAEPAAQYGAGRHRAAA